MSEAGLWGEQQWLAHLRQQLQQQRLRQALLKRAAESDRPDDEVATGMGWKPACREPWDPHLTDSPSDANHADIDLFDSMGLDAELAADFSDEISEDTESDSPPPAVNHQATQWAQLVTQVARRGGSTAGACVHAAQTVVDHLAAGHALGHADEVLCGNIAHCVLAQESIELFLNHFAQFQLPASNEDSTSEQDGGELDAIARHTKSLVEELDQHVASLRAQVWWT